MKKINFQLEPIDPGTILKSMGTESDGAVVVFVGMPRDNSQGKAVGYLEYEIYDTMAARELNKIVDEAYEKWALSDCTVVHRYGRVDIGEASIVIAVSSGHRDEAYKASRYIIDEIKKRVPVWKKEFYTDGSQWITKGS